jgi:hypothetical protein
MNQSGSGGSKGGLDEYTRYYVNQSGGGGDDIG